MQAYRHRQRGTVVEAERLTAENVGVLELMTGGVSVIERDPHNNSITYPALNVPTPEGNRRLQEGFWLVKMGNEFYVARPGQFERTWEEVTDATVQAP